MISRRASRTLRWRYTVPLGTRKFHAPMHVFASMTHAHLRAQHVITTISNPGDNGAVVEGGWREVVDAGDAFSHDSQRFEPASDTDPQDPEHWHIVVQDLINRHIYI